MGSGWKKKSAKITLQNNFSLCGEKKATRMCRNRSAEKLFQFTVEQVLDRFFFLEYCKLHVWSAKDCLKWKFDVRFKLSLWIVYDWYIKLGKFVGLFWKRLMKILGKIFDTLFNKSDNMPFIFKCAHVELSNTVIVSAQCIRVYCCYSRHNQKNPFKLCSWFGYNEHGKKALNETQNQSKRFRCEAIISAENENCQTTTTISNAGKGTNPINPEE